LEKDYGSLTGGTLAPILADLRATYRRRRVTRQSIMLRILPALRRAVNNAAFVDDKAYIDSAGLFKSSNIEFP
jgi:hypothetical protein